MCHSKKKKKTKTGIWVDELTEWKGRVLDRDWSMHGGKKQRSLRLFFWLLSFCVLFLSCSIFFYVGDGPAMAITKVFGFRETFTPRELGLGTASHTRKRECECLGVWFQMLSFGVWVWAGAAVTMDWRRGRDGNYAGEREKTLIFCLVTQTFTRNSGRAVKFFKGKIVFLSFGEVSNI